MHWEVAIKIIGRAEIETVTDVVRDVYRCSTRVQSGGIQFATLQVHWGNGSTHDGERYELHLCECCIVQTVAYLKQERRTKNLFNEILIPPKSTIASALSSRMIISVTPASNR